jgi:hypothetical protein
MPYPDPRGTGDDRRAIVAKGLGRAFTPDELALFGPMYLDYLRDRFSDAQFLQKYGISRREAAPVMHEYASVQLEHEKRQAKIMQEIEARHGTIDRDRQHEHEEFSRDFNRTLDAQRRSALATASVITSVEQGRSPRDTADLAELAESAGGIVAGAAAARGAVRAQQKLRDYRGSGGLTSYRDQQHVPEPTRAATRATDAPATEARIEAAPPARAADRPRFISAPAPAVTRGVPAPRQGAAAAGPVAIGGTKAPATTLVGTSEATFRRAATKAIRADPNHPLRFLLDSTGNFKRTRGLPHSELANHSDLVQMGHVKSSKSGGKQVVLQDAWMNQIDNITVEHTSKGGAYVEQREAIDIGRIGVERNTALMWEREGHIPPGTVAGAKKIP